MSAKDWQTHPDAYEMGLGGPMTRLEALEMDEYERETDRERLAAHAPVFCEGRPCKGCGAYLKFPIKCPLCGDERKAA